MNLQCLYNENSDQIVLPPNVARVYGRFDLPEVPEHRPYVSSNFVVGLDGRASFRELKGRVGGNEVSQSTVDSWVVNFIRSFHDAQLVGASTLREEPGPNRKGWDYRIENADLLDFRKSLGLGKQKVFILSGSGNIDLGFDVFNSQAVDPWIITSATGLQKLEPRLNGTMRTKVLKIGESGRIEPQELMREFHKQGISRLLCEGGPTTYGQLLTSRVIDEEWRTISTQVLGESKDPRVQRPTAYGDVSFVPETAPWFKIVSVHISPPHHLFLRLRYEGPKSEI